MSGISSVQNTPTSAPLLSVDRLFGDAFHSARDHRSAAYKAGVRAALAFRIDDKAIVRPYTAGSAHDDAFQAGQAEGHAIWRAATAEKGGLMSPTFVARSKPFELDESEKAWAAIFFAKARLVDEEHVNEWLSTLLRAMDLSAENHPRHPPLAGQNPPPLAGSKSPTS